MQLTTKTSFRVQSPPDDSKDKQVSPPSPTQRQARDGIARAFAGLPVTICLNAHFPDVLSRLVTEYWVSVLPYRSRIPKEIWPNASSSNAHAVADRGALARQVQDQLEQDLSNELLPRVQLCHGNDPWIDARVVGLMYGPDGKSLKGIFVEFGADVPKQVVDEFRQVNVGDKQLLLWPLAMLEQDGLHRDNKNFIAQLGPNQNSRHLQIGDIVWPVPLEAWNPQLRGFMLRSLNPPDFKAPPSPPPPPP